MRKTAFITGASGDIGFAIAKKFAQNNFNLLLQYNITDIAEKTTYLKNSYGIDVKTFKCDFSKIEDIEIFADNIIKLQNIFYNSIDVIINNSGMSLYGLFQDVKNEDINRIFNINLKAPIIITKKLLKLMISKKEGNIINISSVWGETGGSCETVYSATKAGLIGFTKALAKELAPSHIRVNCISPGVINTKMISSFSDSEISALKDEIPMGRLGLPEDIANAAYFLASENAEYITGEVLKVNGGFYL